jgi:outer membrane protein assembly factor BamB
LISREQARRLGLERAWFGQVQLDRSRNRVERAILAGDRIDVLTTAGVVHEFNALTGETLWIASIGNPNYPSLGPSASQQHVAVLNGLTLYVLDRTDGRPVKIRRTGGAPGAAPALASQHVLVPLVRGRIEGIPLDQETYTPWYFQSVGRTLVAPLATATSIVWTTDAGVVYIGGAEKLGVTYSLETGSSIVASPAYRSPDIYVATTSGELFALDESTGAKRWKYATGYAIRRAPAAVGERVYVTSDEPALHCVDAATGAAVWAVSNVTEFAAASRSRVYGVDELGALVTLDATSGALLGRMPTYGLTKTLLNDQTDRLYLVSDEGIVQCLHEIGAKEPFYHNPPPAEPEQSPSDETAAAPAAGTATQPQPGAATLPAADAGDAFPDDPVGMDEAAEAEAQEQPADDSVFEVEENPFE